VTLKPPALRPGDRVGIIAPAGPVTPMELISGLRTIESSGLVPVPGDHLYDVLDYTAGTDAARLEDLHTMFSHPDIRAVFCARGGYGCLRLLPHIDFGLIAANPKLVMGYSDVTSLLWGLYAKTGLVSVHGPVVKGMAGDGGHGPEILLQWAAERGGTAIDLSVNGRVLRPGRGSGPVFGGNLSLVNDMVGTGFIPDLTGAILFLEETGEPLYKMDRMVTHLALSGLFERIAGLLVGDITETGDRREAFLDLLMEHLDSSGIPVIEGLPVGHGERNQPLPIGIRATLDTDRMRLSYHESCFSA